MDVFANLGPALALIAGIVVHIFKKVIEKRQADLTFHLNDYVFAYPYQTTVAILMAVGGFLGLQEAGQLTITSAFLMGTAANSYAGMASKGER